MSDLEQEDRYGKLALNAFLILEHQVWNNSARDGLRLMSISAGERKEGDCSERLQQGGEVNLMSSVPTDLIVPLLQAEQQDMPGAERFVRDILKIFTLDILNLDRRELNNAKEKLRNVGLCKVGTFISSTGALECETLVTRRPSLTSVSRTISSIHDSTWPASGLILGTHTILFRVRVIQDVTKPQDDSKGHTQP
jgi:hypothetical protein